MLAVEESDEVLGSRSESRSLLDEVFEKLRQGIVLGWTRPEGSNLQWQKCEQTLNKV